MTSPIALLLPLGGAEPAAPQPTVEDTALFSAALVAALQSSMVPAPVPTPTPTQVADQGSQPSEPQTEGQSDGTAGAAETGNTPAEAKSTSATTVLPAHGERERGQPLTAAAAVRRASTPVVTPGPKLSLKEAARMARTGNATRVQAVKPVEPVTVIEASLPTEGLATDAGSASATPANPEAVRAPLGIVTEEKAAAPTGATADAAAGPAQNDPPLQPRASVLDRGEVKATVATGARAEATPSPLPVSMGKVSAAATDQHEAKGALATTRAGASAPVPDDGYPVMTLAAPLPVPSTAPHVVAADTQATESETTAGDAANSAGKMDDPSGSTATVANIREHRMAVPPDAVLIPGSVHSIMANAPVASPVSTRPSAIAAEAPDSEGTAAKPARPLDATSGSLDVHLSQGPSPRAEAPSAPWITPATIAMPMSSARMAGGESRGSRRKQDTADVQADASRTQRVESSAAEAGVLAAIAVPPQTAMARNTPRAAGAGESGGDSDATQAPVSDAAMAEGAAPAMPTESVPAGDGRGLAFAQELAALLGDADITNLSVTVGARERTSPAAGAVSQASDDTASPAKADAAARPLPAVAPQLGGSGSASTIGAYSTGARPMMPRTVAGEAAVPVVDDDLVVLDGGTSPVPSGVVAGPREAAVAPRGSAYQRRAAPVEEKADAASGRSSGGTRSEAVRVRVAEPAPQRAAPLAMPAEEPTAAHASGSARAPILPAARQELPPQDRSEREPAFSLGKPDDPDSREPSDSQSRVSAALPGPGESASRGEARLKEVASGEARNMPDRAETKDRPAGLADRVTLQVADAEGRETRIRVTVQGDQVRAVILPSDQESARHLERRMDDLQAALVRQGFADPKVSVQSPAGAGGQAAWGAVAGGVQSDNASGRGMDQPADDRGQGSGRQHQERGGDGQRHPQQRFRERDRDDRQNQDA